MAEPGTSNIQPESDIYTVLVIVASVFLIAGTVFVGARAQILFDNWLPF